MRLERQSDLSHTWKVNQVWGVKSASVSVLSADTTLVWTIMNESQAVEPGHSV